MWSIEESRVLLRTSPCCLDGTRRGRYRLANLKSMAGVTCLLGVESAHAFTARPFPPG